MPHHHDWATGGDSPSFTNPQTSSHFLPLQWWSQHSPLYLFVSLGRRGAHLFGRAWLLPEPVSLLEEMVGHYSLVAGCLVLFDHVGSGSRSPLLLWGEPELPISEHWPLWKDPHHHCVCGLLAILCPSFSHPLEASLNWQWVDWTAAQSIRLSLPIWRFLFGVGGRGHNFGLRSKPHSPIPISQAPNFVYYTSNRMALWSPIWLVLLLSLD